MPMAKTNGHEHLEKAARALRETSTSSGVLLTRNTARPHDEEVCFPCHVHRRGGPCPCPRSAHDFTRPKALENTRKGSSDFAQQDQSGRPLGARPDASRWAEGVAG